MRTKAICYTLCLVAATITIIDIILVVRYHFASKNYRPDPRYDFKAWNRELITKLKPESSRNCDKLFSKDPFEVQKQKCYMSRWKNSFQDSDLLAATSNCSWVDDYFSSNLYVTELEKSFPIAFTFLIHNSPQQVVRLLRVLYRPHNQYCFAPDLKSSKEFQEIFKNLARCLDNVHMVSELRDVKWGHRSLRCSATGIC